MTRGRGEGSFSRLADGRWVGQISAGVGPDGKRQRPRFYGRTKAEVQDQIEEYRRRLKRGEPVRSGSMRLGEYLESWLESIIRPRGTLVSYNSRLRLHVIPFLGHAPLNTLSRADVTRWQRQMLDAGRTPNTVNAALEVLVTALNDAVRDEYIDRNVAASVQKLRHQKRSPQPLTADQALAFIRQVQSQRLGNFYITTLGLGLRKSEARGILWSAIDGDVIHIDRQLITAGGVTTLDDLKTGTSGVKHLPIPSFVADALRNERAVQRFERERYGERWPEDGPDLVFRTRYGRPLRIAAIHDDFKRQLAAASLPDIHFHDLRHSTATLLLSLGVPMRIVQVILGHSNMRTTEGYAHVMPELTGDAMARLDTFLSQSAQSSAQEAAE